MVGVPLAAGDAGRPSGRTAGRVIIFDDSRRRARLTWAALIKKVYETDPLLCRFCGAEMKIIAFITEHPGVCRILEHIRMPPQRSEPLAHSPPLQNELVCA
ncbi:MAG: hypothetical protein ACE5HV_04440 [Acidobacteriota bacterium]